MDTFYFVAFVLLVVAIVGKAMGFGEREIKLGDPMDVRVRFGHRQFNESSLDINPTTGLPMMGGGVDVGGNAYGAPPWNP